MNETVKEENLIIPLARLAKSVNDLSKEVLKIKQYLFYLDKKLEELEIVPERKYND